MRLALFAVRHGRRRALLRAARAVRSTVELLEQRRMLAVDFGDAPDSYRTTLNFNGARHDTSPNLLLGSTVDDEPDGQPSVGANRDDLNGPVDDEDGVVFTSPVVPGFNATVQVTNGAATGFLNAWLDFNLNGIFDAAEQIFTNQPLPGGSVNNLSFAVPAAASAGQSYARFRLHGTIVPAPVPFGAGGIGEVEDYAIRIDPGIGGELDFGDAPDSYGTTLLANGARHIATNNLRLGNRVDAEPDGQPSANADKDDLTAIDDEDGVTFLSPLLQGNVANVQVFNGAAASRLNAWVDFNNDGGFGAGEQIFTNVALPAASINNLNFNVPASAVLGQTYARFRINTAGGLGPTGFGNEGEVEDYLVRVESGPNATLDYGDAPDSYRTTLGLNGARHTRTLNLRLGAAVDAELNGQPSPNADKDDLNGAPDDEDGVLFLTPLVQGAFATVQVTNGGGAGRLNAWVDFNADGTFGPGEQVFTNLPMAAGSVNVLAFVVPPTATVGQTYSRWRVNATGGVGPFGFGGFGEVEDYLNRVDHAPPPKLDYGDAPDTYGTTFGANGARHNASPNIRLGAAIDAEPDGQPSVNADRDDLTGVPDDEDGVVFLNPLVAGGIAQVQVSNGGAASRLNAWFDFNANGAFEAVEQIFTNVALPAASVNNLAFAIPASAATNVTTYSRWRINTAGGLGPIGHGGFGEVEDYLNRVQPQTAVSLDFGDAPEVAGGPFQYPTLLGGVSGNPARHAILANAPRLGALIDAEPDGQPNLPASGDDAANLDDEDGVTVGGVPLELVQLTLGSVVPITITNPGAPGILNAWFDFDQNGVWSAAEQVAVNLPAPNGVTVFNVNIPATLNPNGVLYSRFRIATAGGLQPTGLASNGEVEDYRNRLKAPPPADLLDFGDAPDFPGSTLAYPTSFAGVSGDPARHVIVTAGPRLGGRIDPEIDGQPNAGATGDDIGLLFGGIDDEDGVTVGGAPLDSVALVPGSVVVLEVANPTGIPGLLNAWFDWNGNGTWDAGEQVAADVPVPPGVTLLPVAVPVGLSPTALVYSRFRLSTQAALTPGGFAQDGEVEDYANKVFVDTVSPFVGGAVVEFETKQAIHIFFSEPIDPSTVDPTDLMALNLDDGSMPVANMVMMAHDNMSAAWVYSLPGLPMSDGDYRFLLPAVSVADMSGNPQMGDFTLVGGDSFFFGGDANRDRRVNIGDFAALAANFNRPGMFSEGNFNYLGNADIADFAILASKYNTALPAARGGPAAAVIAPPAGTVFSRRWIDEYRSEVDVI